MGALNDLKAQESERAGNPRVEFDQREDTSSIGVVENISVDSSTSIFQYIR